MPYCPKRGDLVWLEFSPQAGHEQGGRRPALVLSPESYNGKVGLALACPVTSQVKGYPFEVPVPSGLPVSGVILVDQVRSLDWRARNAFYSCTVPAEAVVGRGDDGGAIQEGSGSHDQGAGERPLPRLVDANDDTRRCHLVFKNVGGRRSDRDCSVRTLIFTL